MLAKLIKYDFRAVKRFGIILLIGIAIATLVGSLVLTYLFSLTTNPNTNFDSAFVNISYITAYLSTYFIVLLLALANTGMLIFLMVHFYKNLVTDEGYLTFTLPVRPKDILRSKLINSFLWSLIISSATMLAFSIMGVVTISASGLWAELAPYFSAIKYLFESLFELVEIDGYILMFLFFVFSLAGIANSHLMYYMAIFLGSVIAKKNKLYASIGCIVGINFVYSSVVGVVYTILLNTSIFFDDIMTALIVMMIIAIAIVTGLNILFYKLTERMMQRSLNLP